MSLASFPLAAPVPRHATGVRWLTYLAGALFSVRLLVTKLEDVNLAFGTLAIVFCLCLVAADLWITVWW